MNKQKIKKSTAKVIAAATLMSSPIAVLKKDGSNFKSWKRTVSQRLINHKLMDYFTQTVEISSDQNGHLLEFLFSSVDSVILDMIDFDENDDNCVDLWFLLLQYGSSKCESNHEKIMDNLDE